MGRSQPVDGRFFMAAYRGRFESIEQFFLASESRAAGIPQTFHRQLSNEIRGAGALLHCHSMGSVISTPAKFLARSTASNLSGILKVYFVLQWRPKRWNGGGLSWW